MLYRAILAANTIQALAPMDRPDLLEERIERYLAPIDPTMQLLIRKDFSIIENLAPFAHEKDAFVQGAWTSYFARNQLVFEDHLADEGKKPRMAGQLPVRVP